MCSRWWNISLGILSDSNASRNSLSVQASGTVVTGLPEDEPSPGPIVETSMPAITRYSFLRFRLYDIVLYRVSGTRRAKKSGYDSSLKREDARRYRRRQSSRLMSTTTVAIMSVEASSTSKRPESLALLMVLPSPAVETILP